MFLKLLQHYKISCGLIFFFFYFAKIPENPGDLQGMTADPKLYNLSKTVLKYYDKILFKVVYWYIGLPWWLRW